MKREPARLWKDSYNDAYSYTILLNRISELAEAWCLRHATLCLFVLMALLIALFVVLMFAIVGVSAVESGVVYNHMEQMV